MSLTIYKSSAGSGKTYTLVKEYLLLVIGEPFKYHEILAITFTNKAAAEMKTRIIFYLTKIADNSNEHVITILMDDIKFATGLDIEIIIERAKKVIGLLLHNYSDFAVQTIDSFAHRIVRTFSYDLFLPVNFEIELNSDKLLTQSVDLIINQIGIQEDLTKTLVDFTESKLDDEKSFNIERDIIEFSRTLFAEESLKFIDKLKHLSIKDFIEIKNKLEKENKDFEILILKDASFAYNLIKTNDISHSAFYYKGNGMGKYFENLYYKKFDGIKPNSFIEKTIEKDKWFSDEATENEISVIERIKPELLQAFNNINAAIEKYFKRYCLNRLINKSIFQLMLLNEVQLTLNELKKVNNVVFISDFNKQIAEIVLNEPVPYIYERIGERYKNYFIDEFQDTSIIQWQNLLPLIDNSLSEGGFNLIVGDGKQAIYRWRGGEVDQFVKLPEIYGMERTSLIEEREANLRRNYDGKLLKHNFRSFNELVLFNNNFFDIIKEILPETVRSIYDDHQQIPCGKNADGYVSVEFLSNSESSDASYDEITNNRVLSIINSLTNDGFVHSDIAVLCRANDETKSIARFLIKSNINVVSSDSLLLTSSPEVLFLISCFRYIHNTDDLIPLFAIVNYLQTNSRLRYSGELQKINKTKADKHKIRELVHYELQENNLDFNTKKLSAFMIYELCEELICIFKLNNRKDPYIIAFIDQVYKFSSKKTNNLADFIEWWDNENKKLSIIMPEGLNAVKISTIHKAKGLEFPAVIFPYANGKIEKTKSKAWVDLDKEKYENLPSALVSISKDLIETEYAGIFLDEEAKSYLDEINMLYVAFTRPSERLYVLSEKDGKLDNIKEKTSAKPKKSVRPANIAGVLRYFLENTGLYAASKSVYEFGRAGKHSHKKENNEFVVPFSDAIISDSISDKVFVKSMFDNSSYGSQLEGNIMWGNIFHEILSKIYTLENAEKAVDDFFSGEIYPDNYKNIFKKKIDTLLTNIAIRPYFKEGLKVLNELEIVNENGRILRPDRIVFYDRSLIIIDYKTGKFNENHKKQINEYARVLETMNYTVKKKILINISSEIMEEVA